MLMNKLEIDSSGNIPKNWCKFWKQNKKNEADA